VNGAGPGTLILLTPGGHKIELNDDGTAMTLTSAGGPVITLDSNGVSIDNGAGATITMQGATVSVNNDALTVQ
jgi:Na+-translocating ferredoxin:NAD+ oxidoreductase RnfG subunit